MKLDFKKGADAIKNAASKVSETGKKVANSASETAKTLMEKKQEKEYEARLKKYNPLSKNEIESKKFAPPKVVALINDDFQREIDVLENAAAFITKEENFEVFHLYSEFVTESEFEFSPSAEVGKMYYADPHCDNHFINIENYFPLIRESKLTELQKIAYDLGAKHYIVELEEECVENDIQSKELAVKWVTSGKSSKSTFSKNKNKGIAEAHFSGTRSPVHPQLYWFSQDSNIKNLIKMRCSDESEGITSYSIELNRYGSISTDISLKIDIVAKKMNINSKFNAENEVEQQSKMIFKLEF